jgi:hypothetical protein
MEQRKLTRKEQLELEVVGKYCNMMNESGLLQSGRRGQLYVVDFKKRVLIEKKQLDTKKKAC